MLPPSPRGWPLPPRPATRKPSQVVEAAQVDAVEALDIGAMEREELQALARELKAQGLTNKQIAEKVGKSEATVSRWLSEK